MKSYKLFFMLLIMSVLLNACGPVYKTTYSYQPPHSESGKMCAAQCVQTKGMCEQACQFNDQSCRMHERQIAYNNYQEYRDRQIAQGLPVKRSVGSFDNSYSNCGKSCHCESNFKLCYQTCGGVVTPHEVCAAFCGK